MTDEKNPVPLETPAEEMPAAEPARLFYSAQARGFFSTHLHDEMPPDVVEITHEEWQALLTAQTTGKQIVPGLDGRPTTVDFVETPEMKRRDLRAKMARLDAQTLRAMRENALDIPAAPGEPTAAERLQTLNQQMADLRAQLKVLS